MSGKLPISVFIIAKNEADRIDKPILSVRDWVDEIIVIDSGSEDETMMLSEKLGAKVMFHEWKGYGPQKIFGEEQCKNDWILNLDADEEVTPELAKSINNEFAQGKPHYRAYKMTWKLLFKYEDRPPYFAPGTEFIRLYHKSYAGFKDSTVHDSVLVREGPVSTLKGIVLHRCFRDFRHWCNKINSYSTMQAEDFVHKGRKPAALRILFEPVLSFLKAYFLRRHFVYGIDGFIGSFLYAYARLLRLAKARELLKKQKYESQGSENAVS